MNRNLLALGTAALVHFGIHGSFAEPTNIVPAVAYVNKDLPPGFSLINVPLRDTGGVIFPTATLPNGFSLYLLREGSFEIAAFEEASQTFSGAAMTSADFAPGRGFFAYNPSTNPVVVTFVGEVPQGTLTNRIPAGFSIQSSQVPQAGTAQALGCPIDPGDVIYSFDASRQRYSIHVFDDLELRWLPTPPPPLKTGDAFLMRSLRAKEWIREFSVNR